MFMENPDIRIYLPEKDKDTLKGMLEREGIEVAQTFSEFDSPATDDIFRYLEIAGGIIATASPVIIAYIRSKNKISVSIKKNGSEISATGLDNKALTEVLEFASEIIISDS